MIWEFLAHGGITMIPLALCSIAALAIIIYKIFELRKGQYIDRKEIKLIKQMIDKEDYNEAQYHCTQNPGVFTNIVSRALEARESGESEIKEAIEEAGRYEIPKIERFLGPLRTIAAISPLLGLFGTVIGMIRVFNKIREVGLGQVTAFSGGIAEALITTATGLAIAIPTLVMYNYFVDKAEQIILEVEKTSADVMRQLISKS
jgi:biopolymer transport protein ExbB